VGFRRGARGIESAPMADLDVRVPAARAAPAAGAPEIAAARAQLRTQIATLERRLTEALIACLPYADGAAAAPHAPADATSRGPRVLDLGELERARDELAARLSAARADLDRRGEHAARARLRLEAMRLEPGRHRFERVTRHELGEGGCGAFEVRPRLGLLGMLMGWWEVKLSSGCPLPIAPATARRRRQHAAEFARVTGWARRAAAARSIPRPWGAAAASGGPRLPHAPQRRRHRAPARVRTRPRARTARR
jgi:hypothetical protein